MPTNTYVALRTETVAVATASVTLSLTGISGYTDLELVSSVQNVSGASTIGARYNGDTGGNYSFNYLIGDGTSPIYGRANNTTFAVHGYANTTQFATSITKINNYSGTTTYKTVIDHRGTVAQFVGVTISTWRNNNAITSITIFNETGSNFAVGSTFSLYGISTVGDVTPKATGGEVYEDATYYYHAFPMSGRFVPNQSITADVLVIAGGGGAGSASGGGGAGGVQYATSQSLTAQSYPVLIGGGGTVSGGAGVGVKGSNSTFNTSTIIANGGGGGSRVSGTTSGTGGSGGGVAQGNTAGSSSAGTGGIFYGNAGSAGAGGSYGGGGGSGAAGSTTSGGAGLNIWSSWASATSTGVSGFYAGGGGPVQNGNSGPFSGGSGGGGAGGISTTGSTAGAGTSGTQSTGSGGGGGGIGSAIDGAGGLGGSGIVIVRYTKA